MSIRLLDNNWIKTGSINYKDPHEQNLVLRVMNHLKSGVDLFNKSSITGQYKRPSVQKSSCQKLPQLTKRNTTEMSMTVHQTTEIENNNSSQTFQTYGRMSILKQDNPENPLKKRLKTSQAKRNFGVSRYNNWNKEKYAPIQMKGVVFRKKKV